MTDAAPRHPLRDLFGRSDRGDPLDWLRGTVVAVDTTAVPHTVSVRLGSGTVADGITFAAWWAPQVGDVVNLLRKGPSLWVLGPDAPANVVPPGPLVLPPALPAAPPVAPVTRTVPVAPIDRAYWSPWGWRSDELVQGGPASRALWFYGDRIAAARGDGTIISASVYMRRVTREHGAPVANVRLAVHDFETRPAVLSEPLPLPSVQGTLTRGQDATVPLSAVQLNALNSGAAGVGLEPGDTDYLSADHLAVYADAASGQLALTIRDA